jgi:ribonucleoside-diphosphate reductase alpha chain
MELSLNARAVLSRRYLLRDEAGNTKETPEGLFKRVSAHVAAAEQHYGGDASLWEERFCALMQDLRFLPNSPTLMNAGKPMAQLSACFVLPVEDSMSSIFESLKSAALILQSGGGTGFSFSRLRPRSDIVHSTGGIASGPVSFMKVFNTATEVIRQGGARRGANMGILRIDHPDILDFIRVKRDTGSLGNFNISVAVTDVFMQALYHDEAYELINPRTNRVTSKIAAKTVFNEMVESAWETGDPGIIFIDVINRFNPTPHIGIIESTNPCGEQPLLPYEACVLGSINLAKYVLITKDKTLIDYGTLSRDIMTAVRFLDDAIDATTYPLHDIELMHKGNRKIGLGIMGWADLLIALGLPYNSSRSFRLAEKVMQFFGSRAREYSEVLARERGVFPNFRGSVYDDRGMPRVRNATTTTIAPTGTLSMIAGCSSGIEPLYSLAHKRLAMDSEISEINIAFFDKARAMGFYSDDLRKQVEKTGTLRALKEVPIRIRRIYRTALEISYRDHIEMQAAFQKYTDNAVSKTINMPRSAKKDDVADAYRYAYEKGCKGVTVFRYGCRKKGVLLRFQDAD